MKTIVVTLKDGAKYAPKKDDYWDFRWIEDYQKIFGCDPVCILVKPENARPQSGKSSTA